MSEYFDRLTYVMAEALTMADFECGHMTRAQAEKAVRAVLAAMEQPSRKMIKAADDLDKDAGPLNDHPATADEIWRAMITAELKDDEEPCK